MRLDDRFGDHPKIVPLSDGAFRLHLSGLLYVASLKTRGRIPIRQVPLLMPRYRPRYLDELTAQGLWFVNADSVEVPSPC